MTTQNHIHRVIAAVYVDIACFLAPFDSVTHIHCDYISTWWNLLLTST